MKFCIKCGTSVTGHRKTCPLCQGPLTGEAEPGGEVFPVIPGVYQQHDLFFRILMFASIAAGIIALAVNLMLPASGWWSLFVLLGIACAWVSTALAVRKRHNIAKGMMYEVAAASVLSVLWDWVTGWHGWSIDYVIPCTCLAVMACLAVLYRVLNIPVRDYLIYFTLNAVFGIIPIIFYFTGRLIVIYPSLICTAVSLISLVALVIFQGEAMRAELKRRLHI